MNELYIIESLATLEKVKMGQKIAVTMGKFQIVDKPVGIFRWLSGDSKRVTVAYIRQIIDDAILKNLPLDGKILEALENLKITYYKSISTVSNLTKLQLDIKNELHKRST
jgi:hypothetical protein